MMISVDKKVYFHGVPSTAVERTFLHERGFIHITGIKAVHQGAIYYVGERLVPHELGQWNINNGMTAIVLACGEVWLRSGRYELTEAEEHFLLLKGRGGFVFLSNNERVEHSEILARVIDPNAGLSFKE